MTARPAYSPRGWSAIGKAGDQLIPLGNLGAKAAMTNQRMVALPYVIPPGRTIAKLRLNVGTVGEANSVIRLGVYQDDYGWPAGIGVDGGTVAGDSLGFKNVTGLTVAPTCPTGILWVVSCCQAAPTTPPQIFTVGNANGFRPIVGDTNSFMDGANYGFIYGAGGATTLPSSWPNSRGDNSNWLTSAPWVAAVLG